MMQPPTPQEQSTISNRLAEFTAMVGQAQSLIVGATAFITVGLGGIIVAARKVRYQLKGVEATIEPIRHEISDPEPDTLTTRVDVITARMDEERVSRNKQHEDNSARLDRIENRMDQVQEDVGAIRKVLDRIMGKLAGI